MGIDIQSLVKATLEQGMTVTVEYDVIPGFEVEVAFVGREELQKLYAKCTKKRWNPHTRKQEETTDRDKLLSLWSERAIRSWSGLTLEGLVKLVPIKLGKDDNPKAMVEASPENKIALMKHNADFDQWVLALATESEVFFNASKEAKKDVESL